MAEPENELETSWRRSACRPSFPPRGRTQSVTVSNYGSPLLTLGYNRPGIKGEAQNRVALSPPNGMVYRRESLGSPREWFAPEDVAAVYRLAESGTKLAKHVRNALDVLERTLDEFG
jgi:hypothetical protein